MLMVAALLVAQSATAAPAHAMRRRKGRDKTDRELQAFVDQLSTWVWPMLQNLGFSGLVGYATGLALKVPAANQEGGAGVASAA